MSPAIQKWAWTRFFGLWATVEKKKKNRFVFYTPKRLIQPKRSILIIVENWNQGLLGCLASWLSILKSCFLAFEKNYHPFLETQANHKSRNENKQVVHLLGRSYFWDKYPWVFLVITTFCFCISFQEPWWPQAFWVQAQTFLRMPQTLLNFSHGYNTT